MHDVVVIGGGLAGATAALAARAQGASVAVAARSWGATAVSTGALDIASTPAFAPEDPNPRTLADHLDDIIAHRPHHPYAVLGRADLQQRLTAGHAILAGALAETGLALAPLDLAGRNRGLPSTLGAFLPAAGALAPHRGLDLAAPGTWGVVRLAGDAYSGGARTAVTLRSEAQRRWGSAIEWVDVPAAFSGAHGPVRTARSLDDHAAVQALAHELVPRVRGCTGLLFPPMLGLDRHAQARAALAELSGMPIVEALAHMPSVPGARLQRALDAAVRQAGCQSIGEVGAPQVAGSLVQALTAADGTSVRARAFVLATGRFVAGGVTWGERCVEALFGLPVMTDVGPLRAGSPHAVVRRTPVEHHPLMTAGVQVNRHLQPMVDGRVALDNVFAAGMVIGGFASRYTYCADGVALATGAKAAHMALGSPP